MKVIKEVSKIKQPDGDIEGCHTNSTSVLNLHSESEKDLIAKAEQQIIDYITTTDGGPDKRSINALNRKEGITVCLNPSQYGEIDEYEGLFSVQRKQTKDEEGFDSEPITLTLKTTKI